MRYRHWPIRALLAIGIAVPMLPVLSCTSVGKVSEPVVAIPASDSPSPWSADAVAIPSSTIQGATSASGGTRDARWAAPVAGNAALPNFFKINDHLYRGAQPTSEGY